MYFKFGLGETGEWKAIVLRVCVCCRWAGGVVSRGRRLGGQDDGGVRAAGGRGGQDVQVQLLPHDEQEEGQCQGGQQLLINPI